MTELFSKEIKSRFDQLLLIAGTLSNLRISNNNNNNNPQVMELQAKLAELGKELEDSVLFLKEEVGEELVSFYQHMKGKESKEVEVLAESHRVVPEGFRPLPQGTQLVFDHGKNNNNSENNETLAISERHNANYFQLLKSLQETREEIMLSTAANNNTVLGNKVQTIHSLRNNNNNTITSNSSTPRPAGSPPPPPEGLPGKNSANLTRTLNDRRTGASALQTFLYLLLECLCTQCDATVAALYLSDSGVGNTNHSNTESKMIARVPRICRVSCIVWCTLGRRDCSPRS
ncbi:hypothetical protein AGDE_15804 [Angomonas deanei]|uniref:Uncharacterized protein n=1 Tax=Angomonas deanei TaxID=59799 RepID=A0A7G2CFF8_9TRYP|nr:hypothetical protein AGDE_15804 [Angomonas deanei]CAD2216872.1 hypothetical protein, conserved [Angomonas deanei]|eukprot:EPY18389.1 hypothetical protein AGDE_15804 [Angomonas deanei]